jgi:uncharacterized protein (DUF342 family)
MSTETTDERSSAHVKVKVSADRMTAYLEASAPAKGERPPSVQDALIALTAARVVRPDPERVKDALAKPGERFVVAEGVPALHGNGGGVEYAPSLLAVGGQPQATETGEVNLFDLGLIHNVAEGAVLATLRLPTPGKAGLDVFGQVVPPRAGRPAPVKPGKGTRLSPDGQEILAAVAGHATLVGQTITVSPIFVVRGDVGPATGHIEFVGSVCIMGNVGPGYRVKAGGDVEIQGNIDGGDIQAGGNVSVRFGIRGQQDRGSIAAGGSVRAKFIEYALVHAGDSVYVTDGIVCGKVQAEARVEVVGRHGSIVGGRVVATQGIKVGDLGSKNSSPTEVVVGPDPSLAAEIQQLQTRVQGVANQLETTRETLGRLKEAEKGGRLIGNRRLELARLTAEYREMADERVKLLERQAALLERLRACRTAAVDAQGTSYTGVRVWIAGASYLVDNPWHSVRFHRNEETRQIEVIYLSAA